MPESLFLDLLGSPRALVAYGDFFALLGPLFHAYAVGALVLFVATVLDRRAIARAISPQRSRLARIFRVVGRGGEPLEVTAELRSFEMTRSVPR
jgi:hypothetical protein